MKDFDYYKTKLPYPRKSDFTTVYGYKHGERIWAVTAEQYQEKSEELETAATIERDTDDEAYRAARTAYNEDEARFKKEFMDDLIEEFGLTGHPKAHQVYNLAWDYGHSAGLAEVYTHFGNFAPLVVD